MGKRSQSVGTPIVSQTVPSSLERHLQRLKTCYLLGLDEMTIIVCRSVLEAALLGRCSGEGNYREVETAIMNSTRLPSCWV